jgi:anaerobic dimethyl sulfoxide reductase subunit C (anchor subunit)
MATEWPLVLFTLIAGAGAGLLVFVGIASLFNADKKVRYFSAIAALVLLVVGAIFSILHLANPANVFAAATNVFSLSPISLELIFVGLSAVVALLYVIVGNREGSENTAKFLGIAGIVFGVLFAYVSGHGYEVIAAKPAWNTALLTLSYATSALTLGALIYLSISAALKEDAGVIKKLAIITVIFAVLQLNNFVAYGLNIESVLEGNAVLYWGAAVVLGSIIPLLAALVLAVKENLAALAYVGVIAALIGSLVFRVVMWAVGSSFLPTLFDIASQSRGLFPLN